MNTNTEQTYAEQQGRKPFDWNEALDAANEEEPSDAMKETLRQMAGEWALCACGNLCSIIPRFTVESGAIVGSPKDDLLRWLGGEFFEAVEQTRYDDARDILERIEARSAILIAEERAKL